MKNTFAKSILVIIPAFFIPLLLASFNEKKIETKPVTHTIEIYQMKFRPAVITVKKGDTVEWINKDFYKHDVTAKGKSWTSKPFGQNEKWSKTFTEDEDYYCNLHPTMKGSIKVE